MLCLKIAEWVANSVDPEETPHSILYAQPVCPNTYGKYCMFSFMSQSTLLMACQVCRLTYSHFFWASLVLLCALSVLVHLLLPVTTLYSSHYWISRSRKITVLCRTCFNNLYKKLHGWVVSCKARDIPSQKLLWALEMCQASMSHSNSPAKINSIPV